MPGRLFCRRRALAVVVAALASACDGGPDGFEPPEVALRNEEMRDQLAGVWLREYAEDGVRTRRLLTLEPDGRFREAVRIVNARGVAVDQLHEGTWLFDGTNLKRKYTLMNGRPPSRLRVPLAAFEVAFSTRNEFVGVDHVHGRRIVYTRVPPETTLDDRSGQ